MAYWECNIVGENPAIAAVEAVLGIHIAKPIGADHSVIPAGSSEFQRATSLKWSTELEESKGMEVLDRRLHDLLIEVSWLGKIAYVGVVEWADVPECDGVAWRNGELIFGPVHEWASIHGAIAAVGIPKDTEVPLWSSDEDP
jgi:hypothetical protein